MTSVFAINYSHFRWILSHLEIYIFSLLLAVAYWNAQRTIMYQINCTHLGFFSFILLYLSQKYQRNNFRCLFQNRRNWTSRPIIIRLVRMIFFGCVIKLDVTSSRDTIWTMLVPGNCQNFHLAYGSSGSKRIDYSEVKHYFYCSIGFLLSTAYLIEELGLVFGFFLLSRK